MTPRREVLWLASGFREYRRSFLLRVAERLADDGIDFIAVHTHAAGHTNQSGELEDTAPSVPLRARRWRPRGREVLLSTCPPRWLTVDLMVLPESIAYPTSWAILGARSVRGRRTAAFGHGADFAKLDRDDVAERLNQWRMRHLDWWFAYNAPSVDAVVERGMPRDRVTSVENTLDTGGLRRVQASFGPSERAALRRTLRLGDGPVGIFVGAIHPHKRPSLLVEVADEIRKQRPDFSMLVVGDGDLSHVIDEAATSRPWLIRLAGDVTDRRAQYWAIADVALYPAWGGLAINEALALGVPPAIGSSWLHPPESSYVKNNVNGLVVPATDAETFASAVVEYLADGALKARLSARAVADGERLSVEAMAQRFCDGVVSVLARPTRRSEGLAS